MNMSLNELTAALKRSFEGLGFCLGDYEDAARMVVWLESHGLNGLAEVQQGLPYLNQRPHQYTSMQPVTGDDRWVSIDAKGESVLSCAGHAIDLAYTQACETTLGLVQLQHAHNRKLVIERLVNCGRRDDIGCIAFWCNGHGAVTEHVVNMVPVKRDQANGINDKQYPQYRYYHIAGDALKYDQQSLYIMCSSDIELLNGQLKQYRHTVIGNETVISPQQFILAYAQSLEQGIMVNDTLLDNIHQLTQRILVESTAQSRSGAGA